LKASHIFLDKNLRIEIIDLGFAEENSDGNTSTPAGTFHAMSPEMANLYLKSLNKEEIDYQKDLITFDTDLYSLGVLVLEMLTGQLP